MCFFQRTKPFADQFSQAVLGPHVRAGPSFILGQRFGQNQLAVEKVELVRGGEAFGREVDLGTDLHVRLLYAVGYVEVQQAADYKKRKDYKIVAPIKNKNKKVLMIGCLSTRIISLRNKR